MPPDVSIITVYYNTPEELRALHKSARQQLANDEYEWIVADNDSRENLSAELSNVTYLRLPQNFGFAKANNIAAKEARGRYLFFVNPDCRFMANPLPDLVRNMANARITGPRVLNEDGSIQISFGPTLSLWSEFRQKSRVRRESSRDVQNWLHKQTASVFTPGFIGGCALMIDAGLYRELGGFDENFFLYEEDVDLCKRAAERGATILFIPTASIIHLRNRAAAKDPGRSEIFYRRSQIYYYRKHHGRFQNFVLTLYLKLKFAFQPAISKMIWKDEGQVEPEKMPLH